MDYRDSFYLFGADAKQIPIIPRHGAPTEDTEGAIGLLCMDVSAPGAPMYKCVEVTEDDKYIWVPFSGSGGSSLDDIKEMLPAIKSFDLVLEKDFVFNVGEEHRLGDDGLVFSAGDCFKIELYFNGEFVDSATEYLTSNGYMVFFGNIDEFPILGDVIMICPEMYVEYTGEYEVDEAGENLLPVEGYSIKVYKKALTMDKDFVDTLTNSVVPVIKSERENPIAIESLETGVYVLHGTFALSDDYFDEFEYNARLCHVYKEDYSMYIYYQDAAFCMTDIAIHNGTITERTQYHLDGMLNLEDVAPSIVEGSDYGHYPVSGDAVVDYINNKVFPCIYMESEDGKKLYTITVGADGNLKITDE